MDVIIKSGEVEALPVLADEESAAKLLHSSEDSRPSFEGNQSKPVEKEIPDTSPRRKYFPSLWDLRKEKIPEGITTKVYKRRWLMIFIFSLSGFVGGLQYSTYTIIANVIIKYYGISRFLVDLTIFSYLITYLVGFLPAVWFVNNMGLRWSMLFGCFFTALGCFLRVFSVAPDRFWLAIVSQWLVGIAAVVFPVMTTRLVAVWFPANQVSFAYAFSFTGGMIGATLGTVVPPHIVQNSDKMEEIAESLNLEFVLLAALAFVSLVVTAAFFQEAPPLPPSQAEKLRKHGLNTSGSVAELLESIKRLFRKRTYVILVLVYCIASGVFSGQGTRLNQLIISHFPGSEKVVGVIGLSLSLPGLLGGSITGYVLDRTRAFKTTAMCVYIMTLLGWISFSVALQMAHMISIFVSTTFIGLATSATQPVLFELAVEVTYPEAESTVTGLITAVNQICHLVFTLFYGLMLEKWSDNVANIVMTFPLVVSLVGVTLIRPKLRRQAAQQTQDTVQKMEVLG